MRWLALLLVAGCGGSSAKTTGLTVELDYDDENIATVVMRGAATTRNFGPYQLSVAQAPPSSTVGLVFDEGDAGTAMVCADAKERSGEVRQSGCIMPTVAAGQVADVKLQLADVH